MGMFVGMFVGEELLSFLVETAVEVIGAELEDVVGLLVQGLFCEVLDYEVKLSR